MSCEEGQDGVHMDSGMLLLQQLGKGSGMGCRDHTARFFYYFGGWGNVSSTTPPGKPVARSTKASYGVGTGPRLWS